MLSRASPPRDEEKIVVYGTATLLFAIIELNDIEWAFESGQAAFDIGIDGVIYDGDTQCGEARASSHATSATVDAISSGFSSCRSRHELFIASLESPVFTRYFATRGIAVEARRTERHRHGWSARRI